MNCLYVCKLHIVGTKYCCDNRKPASFKTCLPLVMSGLGTCIYSYKHAFIVLLLIDKELSLSLNVTTTNSI